MPPLIEGFFSKKEFLLFFSVIPKEEIMPVPTPRTIQPLTESDLHEDDHIPEDWKENNNNNENEEVHSKSKIFF